MDLNETEIRILQALIEGSRLISQNRRPFIKQQEGNTWAITSADFNSMVRKKLIAPSGEKGTTRTYGLTEYGLETLRQYQEEHA
jgi:hypothetical protein